MSSFIGESCTYAEYRSGRNVKKAGVIISGPDLIMTQDEPRYYFLIMSAGVMTTVDASRLSLAGTKTESESKTP